MNTHLTKKQIEVIKLVSPFLELNGFTRMLAEEGSWENEFCSVQFQENCYAVCDNEGGTIYSSDFGIYWLIGVLTYYGYMPQNYKKVDYENA